jgi:hypothetical protein
LESVDDEGCLELVFELCKAEHNLFAVESLDICLMFRTSLSSLGSLTYFIVWFLKAVDKTDRFEPYERSEDVCARMSRILTYGRLHVQSHHRGYLERKLSSLHLAAQ